MFHKASIPENGEGGIASLGLTCCSVGMFGGWRAGCAGKEGFKLGGQLMLHPRLLHTTWSQSWAE